MSSVQKRMQVANEKSSKNILNRGNVPKSNVSALTNNYSHLLKSKVNLNPFVI